MGVVGGDEFFEHAAAASGPLPMGADHILDGNGKPPELSHAFPALPFFVDGAGLGQRLLAIDVQKRVDLAILCGNRVEIGNHNFCAR